ncbi:hypothetical protein ABZV77_08735 [Streptomyces sp. NPDC004732]|uniref:hypothetical protein n=1 Tax=Streptomyces sp. NPDC004732 TaxID=3154290 RepID=UPI0033BA463F
MAVLGGGRRRGLVWGVAVVGAVAAVGLTLVAVLVDLDTADRVASLVGAVAGLAGLGFSAYALAQPGGGSGSASHGVVRARGRGAVAAGGDVTGNAFGADSKTFNGRAGTRARTQPQSPTPGTSNSGGHVSARGDGAVTAEGDVRGNAFGDGSEADSR